MRTYKGYTITRQSDHYCITQDGRFVATCDTFEECRKEIDEMVADK